MKKRILISIIVVALFGLSLSACALHLRARPVAVTVYGPPVEYGYQPMIYDGYVVYYSDDGIPYYYDGGVRVWIPVQFRGRYVSHWRTHNHAYIKWHKKRGHYYRGRRYHKHKRALKEKKRRKGHKHDLKPVKEKRLKPVKAKPALRPVDDDDDDRKHKRRKVKKPRIIKAPRN
jgi:hypothetical protein